MIRKALLSLIVGAVAIHPALGQTEDPVLRKEVTALYAQWDKLVMAGDVKSLMAMVHPSFKQYDVDGKVKNYKETKAEMEAMKSMFKEPKCKITVQNVYRDGEEIVAWNSMTVSFKADMGGGKWQTQSFSAKFVETFKRFNGKLMFVSSQMLPG